LGGSSWLRAGERDRGAPGPPGFLACVIVSLANHLDTCRSRGLAPGPGPSRDLADRVVIRPDVVRYLVQAAGRLAADGVGGADHLTGSAQRAPGTEVALAHHDAVARTAPGHCHPGQQPRRYRVACPEAVVPPRFHRPPVLRPGR